LRYWLHPSLTQAPIHGSGLQSLYTSNSVFSFYYVRKVTRKWGRIYMPSDIFVTHIVELPVVRISENATSTPLGE
jgi:hypothetical protein